MINIVKAKESFKEYISNYDIGLPKINLKVIHTYHVADNARKIAKELNLDEENQQLAELIGLLHDIGRFEQVRLYNTFSDEKSVNHAEKGLEVLFKDNQIRNFIDDNKFDNIIYKAIGNHNRIKIEDNLSEEELLHCKIIRDADKLDIFRAFLEEKIEDLTHLGTSDISKEILSPSFFEDFKKEKLLLYSDCKTDMDFMVAIIAFIYEFNFNESLKIIKDNDYIRKIVKRINAQDLYTKEKMDEIAEMAMNYIDRKQQK